MENKKPLSGIKYAAAVLNPLTNLIKTRDDHTGLEFYAYKRDVIGRTLFRTGRYERTLSDWLISRFSSSGKLFIDIGANLGYFSCLLAKLGEANAKIISIEPEPSNYALLKKNIELNKINNIHPLQIALGEKSGEATLNIYKDSNRGRHSIVAPGSGKKINVPLRRLDDITEEYFERNTSISFIKMDVEGYEPFVLKGGKKTLARTEYMSIEYAPYILKSISSEIDPFIENLRKNFSRVSSVINDQIELISFDEIKNFTDAVDLILEK